MNARSARPSAAQHRNGKRVLPGRPPPAVAQRPKKHQPDPEKLGLTLLTHIA
jgi:hypothetical protein